MITQIFTTIIKVRWSHHQDPYNLKSMSAVLMKPYEIP
jgi:hypothetical protein